MNAEQGFTQHNLPHRCTNCGHELSSTAQYCPICGQKSGPALVPLRALFVEFLENLFNIDSRFFRTVVRLFIPGYLTREFFKGKHVSYFRPVKLFFTTLLILYAVMGIIYLGKMQSSIDQETGMQNYFARKRAVAMIDSLKQSLGYDTLEHTQWAILDSLTQKLGSSSDLSYVAHDKEDSVSFHFTFEDFYELELDSIYKKYEITSFSGRLLTQHLIRAKKNPEKQFSPSLRILPGWFSSSCRYLHWS